MSQRPVALTFLSYAPRSGSTKLAHELARASDDVLVVPEFRSTIWLADRVANARPVDRDAILSTFSRDPQLSDVVGDPRALAEELAEDPNPSIETVTHAIVRAHARTIDRPVPEVALLKLGRSIERHDVLAAELPGVRFLHLVRDPRGVANSMIRSVVPRDPHDVAFARNNPRYPARLWRQRHQAYRAALEALGPERVEIAHYRDLDDASAIHAAVRWLVGAHPAEVRAGTGAPSGASGPAFALSEAERSIHRLADQGFDAGRDAAWRSELDPRVAEDLRVLLWHEMAEAGLGDGPRPTSTQVGLAHARDTAKRPLEVLTRARTILAGRYRR